MPQVKDYLTYFRRQSHPALFRANLDLDAAARRYGDVETHEVIYEICLNRAEQGMDFSVRVDTPDAPCKKYWLELNEAIDREDRLRVCTGAMSKDAAASLLRDLHWQGDTALLDQYLTQWDPYCRQKGYILDYDILPDGISEKISVSTGPKSRNPRKTDEFLRLLEEEGLCRAEKAQGVAAWVRTYPQFMPFIQNDVSHFRFSFDSSGLLDAKACLRQTDACSWTGYRAFFRPVQMNLELTTRCPLHCPQCYVSLNTGKELPLDTALYWIRQAAEYGVIHVNLSGGETLCYPYLNELIRECARHSMRAAVALSGAYVTEDVLREMIDAGVDEIYVSLNGSTEEINARTRDGYALAIHALELLQKLNFTNRWVNWVMHASNAEDLPDMLALCERYGVKGLVVLGFKPDSSHALGSFPTAEQLRQAAKTIRQYKGPLIADAEPCFSQLRTLISDGFLFNTNLGVLRGCGAGRDGLSVNVDGKLTPCRHLDIAEDAPSMAAYWEHSPFLRRLREVEDYREAPCRGCQWERNCLPCMAVGMKLHDRLNYGMAECPLGRTAAQDTDRA